MHHISRRSVPQDSPPSYDDVKADQGFAYRRKVKISERGYSHVPGTDGDGGRPQEAGSSRSVSSASASASYMPMDRFSQEFTLEQQGGIKNALGPIQASPWLAYRFAALKDYQLDFIIDNSASMSTRDGMVDPETGHRMTRMQEACNRLANLAEILAYIPVKQITLKTFTDSFKPIDLDTSPEQIAQEIKQCLHSIEQGQRNGTTPLYKSIETSFREAGNTPRITYVFNDGEPNKGGSANDVCRLLSGRNAERNPVCLIACTDDQNSIGWMNDADGYPGIHVVDDFQAEMKEVKAKQGESFPFTEGFYLMSTLLGPVDPFFDKADENHIFNHSDYQEIMGRPVPKHEYEQYRAEAYRLQKGFLASVTAQLYELTQNAWAQCTIL